MARVTGWRMMPLVFVVSLVNENYRGVFRNADSVLRPRQPGALSESSDKNARICSSVLARVINGPSDVHGALRVIETDAAESDVSRRISLRWDRTRIVALRPFLGASPSWEIACDLLPARAPSRSPVTLALSDRIAGTLTRVVDLPLSPSRGKIPKQHRWHSFFCS